jgi:hypothetical protein
MVKMSREVGKGDKVRPTDLRRYEINWDKINWSKNTNSTDNPKKDNKLVDKS